MDQEQMTQTSQSKQSNQPTHASEPAHDTHTTARKHNPKKHGILMLACCLIPIALVLAFSAFGFKSRSLGSLAILICPLMHIGMMISMKKSKNEASCCAHDQPQQEATQVTKTQ